MRVHKRLAWRHLCHSVLSRTSFSSSSHSTLPVVLLSIPSLSLFFRLCCLFAPSSLSLCDLIHSLSPNKLILKHTPVRSLLYSLHLILYLHFLSNGCSHVRTCPSHFTESMHVRRKPEGQRETSGRSVCLRQVEDSNIT